MKQKAGDSDEDMDEEYSPQKFAVHKPKKHQNLFGAPAHAMNLYGDEDDYGEEEDEESEDSDEDHQEQIFNQ